MSDNPQKFTGAGFARRLAVFYAVLFVTIGVQLPFLPLWLAAKGLEAGTIGVVLALPMIVRVFTIPVVARAADRNDSLRGAILIATAASVLGYVVLGFAQGAIAIMGLFALASIAFAPVMPLIDTFALRGLASYGRAYGPVRLWGSASFIVASLGAGTLLDLLAPRDLIWLVVAAMALTAASACSLAPLASGGSTSPATQLLARALLRDRTFLAVAIAASLVQASHAIFYGFSAIDWQAAGYDGAIIGALWALGVVAEIILFAASARLRISPTTLVLLGAVAAVIRWSALALTPPLAWLPALQCLHALSFGATHLGALGFVMRAAPPGLGATAQGYLAVAQGLVMAAAMALSGMLYGRYGALAYGAMAAIAAVGGCFALSAKVTELKGSGTDSRVR
jgi:MFS transporter, PPP family, 3-phenylpropionic acid transporter